VHRITSNGSQPHQQGYDYNQSLARHGISVNFAN
jgi:hypothetical protein